MINTTYVRGVSTGIMFGFCAGLLFMAIIFQDKLPNNPNYVEQTKQKIQDRLQ